jgi:hypothetical protein
MGIFFKVTISLLHKLKHLLKLEDFYYFKPQYAKKEGMEQQDLV